MDVVRNLLIEDMVLSMIVAEEVDLGKIVIAVSTVFVVVGRVVDVIGIDMIDVIGRVVDVIVEMVDVVDVVDVVMFVDLDRRRERKRATAWIHMDRCIAA